MYKLFSKTNEISNEMIEEQLNDPVINKLINKFDELIRLSDSLSTKLVTSVSYFRIDETKRLLEDIDKIIYDRFKIKTQHISGSGIGYAVLTVPPVNLNIIAGDIEEKFNMFKDILGKNKNEYSNTQEVTEKDVKNKKYIKDIFKDEKSIIYHTYNSFLKLENVLKSNSVKINLKNATIENLPNDYIIFIIADLYTIINEYKFNSRELVAVLLHEIGHQFTHLENSYRTVQTTTLLLDTIRDNITNSKDRITAFNLAYKNVLDGEEDLTKYSEPIAAIRLIDKYMQKTIQLMENDRHSFTDSEQLADQFANRFGLGNSLVSALAKLHGNSLEEGINYNETKNIIVLLSYLVVMIILCGLIIIPVFILSFILAVFILKIIFGSDDSNATIYDSNSRRYKRIKNDMVKILRTTDLDKKMLKSIIDELDLIDRIIDKAGSDRTLLDKLGDSMPWNKKINRFQKLEELMEDLSENNLYIASSRLKLIK